jgi:branched-chain amino acid transport system ATP-binding protein
VLEVRDLKVNYGGIRALLGLTMEVAEGRVVTLVGANGAGKSTLLRTICGLVRPQAGQILFTGQDLTGWPTHRIMRQGLAMVPEGRRVFANLSVMENLSLGGYHRPRDKSWRDDLDRVFDLFPRLAERPSQAAGTLSGGEQQMLALARGLMSAPRLLLLDEPSLGLAPRLVDEVFGVIERIREAGVTILLVEQNAAGALEAADYGYVLAGGAVVIEGPGQKLLDDQRVRDAYLGETEMEW